MPRELRTKQRTKRRDLTSSAKMEKTHERGERCVNAESIHTSERQTANGRARKKNQGTTYEERYRVYEYGELNEKDELPRSTHWYMALLELHDSIYQHQKLMIFPVYLKVFRNITIQQKFHYPTPKLPNKDVKELFFPQYDG